jgi:hypothetical protein
MLNEKFLILHILHKTLIEALKLHFGKMLKMYQKINLR